MRRRIGSVLVLALLLTPPIFAQRASADLVAHDPDDVGSSFDIRRVRSFSVESKLHIRISFYDDLRLRQMQDLRINFDSRSGPGWDFIAYVVRIRGSCEMAPRREISNSTRISCDAKPNRFALSFPRRLLQPTHAIRWHIRLVSFAGDQHIDRAPDAFADWYPRV